MKFVDRVIPVGCIYLDHLLPYRERFKEHRHKGQGEYVAVSIFTCNITHNDHYTKYSTRSFLINCAKLAERYPHCRFTVKTKDADDVDIIISDKEFFSMHTVSKDNFSFAKQARHDYAEILGSSDIVIAIGFTTPGIEGLLLGKRAIYYSELESNGQTFKNLPYFIAHNYDELNDLFAQAMGDYRTYSSTYSSALDELDPFRDGKALARIHGVLLNA
jgi:hypothetical protein